MRCSRIFAVLLLLACAVCAPASDQFHLTRVVLTGSKRYSQADLLRATGLTIDSKVTVADLQNAASRLNSYGVFSTVQYLYKPAIGTVNSVEADFELTDAPQFLPARFDNFLWFSPEEVGATLHDALPLYNGELPLSGGLPDEVSSVLSKMLAAKNLPSEVSYILEGEQGKPPREYLFKVEHANLKVSAFSFSGVRRMDANLVMQSVAPLKGADFFHSIIDSWVTSKLADLYQQNGYLQAALEVKPRLGENGAVTVDVAVNEGVQYRVAGFTWSGNTLISSEELSKRLTLKPGEPANGVKLARDLGEVRKLYGKFGREGARIHPAMAFSEETVRYTLEVTEGDVYHMGKLEVLAPDQYKQKVQDAWRLPEGAVYDNTHLLLVVDKIRKFVPSNSRWEWKAREQIDDANKVVNVQLEVATK